MQRSAQLVTFMILITLLSIPWSCFAETGEPTNPGVLAGDNVDRLAKAVENLSRILEKQADSSAEEKSLRKLDIAISYLNFRSRRIERMERDLNMARNERNRYQDGIDAWKDRLQLITREMEENLQGDQQEQQQRKLECEHPGHSFWSFRRITNFIAFNVPTF